MIGSDVTIDLNGFELVGIAGSGTGIVIGVGQSNVTIRNGAIRNWGAKGIDGAGNARVRVENVRVINNGSDGIVVDVNGEVLNCVTQGNVGAGIKTTDNCLIENCQAISTTGLAGTGILTGNFFLIDRCISRSNAAYGISCGQYCTLTNCLASSNSQHGFLTAIGCNLSDCNGSSNTSNGFTVGASAVVRHCVANSNGGNGINADYGTTLVNCTANVNRGDAGIRAANFCTVIGCAADFNTSTLATSAGITVSDGSLISQCTVTRSDSTAAATNSTGMGINVTQECTVERCNVTGCKGDGIRAVLDCSIIANNCSLNGFNPVNAAGIHTIDSGNRIESNTVNRNGRGIEVSGSHSLQVKNGAHGNGTNYLEGPNNDFGTSQPWTDFSY